ncbi:ribonuclease P protein component [Candidatus Synechococcus calcipolaris G9]|uniref:Ribonuclease P protein component n=1 Tax=Candidatus Synechococcus calcipolaris G9 TaxID=1497997 RepID=A0ABT6EXH5_9SYNE|nr:ribonuclease P protein component [Candidatus Synechococcus calcipolaris]MDG2990067.1 ribonuclease P protein component [Candidatus Synechococcus calcipolaris G9]
MLPAQHRLRHRRDFARVYQQGTSFHSPWLVLWVCPQTVGTETRIGIVVGSKVSKKAVQRNRIKRQLRVLCRQLLPLLVSGWDVVLVARAAAVGQQSGQFLPELKQLVARAGLFHARN